MSMIVSTTIFKMDGTAFYSPEFPRGGLAATFALDVSHLVGNPTVTVTVQHRNEDETSFSDAGTFTSITTTGAKSVDVSALKEVVRLKVEFDAGDDSTDGMHFLVMAPSWRPYS